MADFLAVMHAYFRGEKLLAWSFLVLGLVMLGFAIWVLRSQAGGFRLGLAIPLVLAGALMVIAGPLFAQHNDRLAHDIEQRASADPAALAQAEGERMNKVNANWPKAKRTWAVIALLALGVILFVERDWAVGLALVLLLLTTMLMFVDVFGERRAVPYTQALAKLPAAPG
jgi:ABC-type multidrug transport system fused ATPase/permease subunit